MKTSAKYLGIVSSLCILVLLLVFCYANPYNNEISLDINRQINILLVIALPTVVNFFSFIFNKHRLSIITLVWLTPFALYMGLSKIPSLWNWFVLFVLLQSFTLFILKRRNNSKILQKD